MVFRYFLRGLPDYRILGPVHHTVRQEQHNWLERCRLHSHWDFDTADTIPDVCLKRDA
jgi:hypothetical protein